MVILSQPQHRVYRIYYESKGGIKHTQGATDDDLEINLSGLRSLGYLITKVIDIDTKQEINWLQRLRKYEAETAKESEKLLALMQESAGKKKPSEMGIQRPAYLPTYQPTNLPIRMLAKGGARKLGIEVNPLLYQAFEITPQDLEDVIKSAEEPDAMKKMFLFLSDYATLSDPKTRALISDAKLNFIVEDLKRRMAHVAEVYRKQAEEHREFGYETAPYLLKIAHKAEDLSKFLGKSRQDKVAFIDAVVGLEHTSGSIIPIAFGITDYGREDYWHKKLLAFLRTHGMPGMVREAVASGDRRMEYRLPLEELKQLALRIQQYYRLPNIYLGGSQSPKSHHYPERTSDIDLFSYFNTYEENEKYAKTVGKDVMELLTFVPKAGLAGETKYKGITVHLSISFCDLKPEKLGGEDDQVLLVGYGCRNSVQTVREAVAPNKGEPKINWNLNIREGMIVYMPPEEYMERVNIFNRIGMQRVLEEERRAKERGYRGIGYYPALSESSYRSILEGIRAGNEIDVPNLVYRNGMLENQEGFHRALVARDIGIGKIPVQVIGEMPSSFSRALNLRWNENLTGQVKAINALKGKVREGVSMIREAITPEFIAPPLECIKFNKLIQEFVSAFKLFYDGFWRLEEEKVDEIFKEYGRMSNEDRSQFRKCVHAFARANPKRLSKTYLSKYLSESEYFVREAVTPTPEFKANPNLISKEAARAAYIGTSFDPEKRAEQAISGFAQEVQAVYERLKPHARTDAEKALLVTEMERFQASYAQKYNDLLYSHSRIVSTMIAGPSGFPAERMRKINEAYDKKAHETYEWKDRAEKAILRALKGLATEEAGGEIAVLKAKIAQAEKLQEMMVEANKIIRKKAEPGIGGVSKHQQLINMGFTERQAAEALTPDFAGRLGFPQFALSNNSANIRRMKERLVELEKREVTPTAEIPFTGGRIVDNREADRVQIIFDQKPPQEMINKLRSEGWHWSPSIGAWQRKRTDYAMMSARRITGAAQPSAVTAPPQAAVKPPVLPRVLLLPQPQVLLLPHPEVKKEVPEPTGYFTLRKAQELIRENNLKLSDEQLHKKSIQLRDYIRFIETPDEYSRKTLVKGGYYAGVIDQYVTGMVPVDPFLHQNLKSTLDEVYKEQQRRKQEKEKISVPVPKILLELVNLLNRYKKHQEKVDEISKQTEAILRTSAMGQAPPVFHRLVDKQLDIIKKDISPLWDTLKNYIVPNSNFKTFWQETRWTLGTLPPSYQEIEAILNKYSVKIPAVPEKAAPPVAKPAPRQFVQTTFQVEERMRRYGYA